MGALRLAPPPAARHRRSHRESKPLPAAQKFLVFLEPRPLRGGGVHSPCSAIASQRRMTQHGRRVWWTHALLSTAVLFGCACVTRRFNFSLLEQSGRVVAPVGGGSSPTTSHELAFAGIVPYIPDHKRRHPRAVACGGSGSSLGCVLSAATDGLRELTASPGAGPGRVAVQQAAKGKGFAPWDVSQQTRAQRTAARQAIAESGTWHTPTWLAAILHGAANLDHEIDYGGRPLSSETARHRRGRTSRSSSGRRQQAKRASTVISTTIARLEKEKAMLHQALQLGRRPQRRRDGPLQRSDGWLDGSDREVPAAPWAY